MRFDPPPLGPGISFVVMVDISDEHGLVRLVDDQANVPVHPRRPKVAVFAIVDLVELKSVTGGIHLQIEDTGLHCLLVLPGQAVESGCESVCYQKVHLSSSSGT